MLGVFVWAQGPERPANRAAAALMGSACFWAGCEVLWNVCTEPGPALRLVRLSSLGWVGLGSLGMEMLLLLSGTATPRTRALRPVWVAAALGFVAVDVATPWTHPAVVRQSWGWSYTVGPAFPVVYAFIITSLGFGMVRAARALRVSPSPAERQQLGAVMAAFGVPVAVATVTEVIAPLLGRHLPRFGTASFVFIGATVAWSFRRWGHSLLAPRAFAAEILEALGDGVALLHLDGRIRSANGALGRLVGRPPAALEGEPVGGFLPDAPLEPPREVRDVETELQGHHGAVPVSLASALLRDKLELPIGLVLVVRDLREVVALRRRVLTEGRLAAVGELAAGIAHEINNPVAYVGTNLGVLRRQLEEPGGGALEAGEARELLDDSLEGVERIASIVRDLKGFAGSDSSARELVDLNRLVESLLRVLGPRLRRRARVEVSLSDVPPVPGSPAELREALGALLLNAADAVEERGNIRVSTGREERSVLVCVEDDGRGIPPEILDRIFDPFFTTRSRREAAGLGLAVAWQVVRQHGGEIAVESQPARGTCVRVRLPASG
jgi:signal transduction histidine kinase